MFSYYAIECVLLLCYRYQRRYVSASWRPFDTQMIQTKQMIQTNQMMQTNQRKRGDKRGKTGNKRACDNWRLESAILLPSFGLLQVACVWVRLSLSLSVSLCLSLSLSVSLCLSLFFLLLFFLLNLRVVTHLDACQHRRSPRRCSIECKTTAPQPPPRPVVDFFFGRPETFRGDHFSR